MRRAIALPLAAYVWILVAVPLMHQEQPHTIPAPIQARITRANSRSLSVADRRFRFASAHRDVPPLVKARTFFFSTDRVAGAVLARTREGAIERSRWNDPPLSPAFVSFTTTTSIPQTGSLRVRVPQYVRGPSEASAREPP